MCFFSIKLRLKNYFLIIFFSFRFRKGRKQTCMIKNKNSFKRRWNIKRLYWNTQHESEWGRKRRSEEIKTTNSFKTFSFISFQWLFRFAHSSWNFFSIEFLKLKCRLLPNVRFEFSWWNKLCWGLFSLVIPENRKHPDKPAQNLIFETANFRTESEFNVNQDILQWLRVFWIKFLWKVYHEIDFCES